MRVIFSIDFYKSVTHTGQLMNKIFSGVNRFIPIAIVSIISFQILHSSFFSVSFNEIGLVNLGGFTIPSIIFECSRHWLHNNHTPGVRNTHMDSYTNFTHEHQSRTRSHFEDWIFLLYKIWICGSYSDFQVLFLIKMKVTYTSHGSREGKWTFNRLRCTEVIGGSFILRESSHVHWSLSL